MLMASFSSKCFFHIAATNVLEEGSCDRKRWRDKTLCDMHVIVHITRTNCCLRLDDITMFTKP